MHGEIKILRFCVVEKWRVVNLWLANSCVRQKLERIVKIKCSEMCTSTTRVYVCVCVCDIQNNRMQ